MAGKHCGIDHGNRDRCHQILKQINHFCQVSRDLCESKQASAFWLSCIWALQDGKTSAHILTTGDWKAAHPEIILPVEVWHIGVCKVHRCF